MKKALLIILSVAVSLPADMAQATVHTRGDIAIGGLSEETVWTPATAPWFSEMVGSSYTTRVKEFLNIGQILEVEREGQSLFLQPLALEWTNNIDQIQQISMPEANTPSVNNSEIEWFDAYGLNIDFAWEVTPSRLNKTLTIAGFSDLPPPPQYIIDGGNPVLRLNLLFDPDSTLDIFVNGNEWNKQTTVTTFDNIEFRYLGETLYSFAPLMFWDSEDNEAQSIATLEKRGNSLYISIRVPYSWLQTAVFPVFIDADISVGGAYSNNEFSLTSRFGPYWTDNDTAYYLIVSGGADVVWSKTTDSGANWSAQNSIIAGTFRSFDVWWDGETDGDAGTKIHFAGIDTSADNVLYGYLDTSDDSEFTDIVEAAQGDGTINAASDRAHWMVSITKSRGGTIWVGGRYEDNSAASFSLLYESTDGDNWTSRSSPLEETDADYIMLFPANLADDEDIWSTYWDWSADEISLKTWDDSNLDWTTIGEATISGSMIESAVFWQHSGQIRHSDGHLIFTAWTQLDNAASDLKVWDITDSGTITAKTDVITNTVNYAQTAVFVNQVNDDLYVAYFGGTTWTGAVKSLYQKSTDGGSNWDGSDQAMQANAEDDERSLSAGAIKSDVGGFFMPIWVNDDLVTAYVNIDNAVTLPVSAGVTAPTVTTANATDVSFTTVTGDGNITATGGANATSRGFQYGIGDFADNVTESGNFGTGNFTAAITGLTNNTEYQHRTFAINSAGIGFGASVNFTTLDIIIPVVVTVNATSVSFTSVTGNGNIIDVTGANATSRGFQYGIAAFTDNVSEAGDFGTGNFTLVISALTHNTEYQYRVFAENSEGIGFGASVNFTTLEILIPVVVTGNATGITSSTATGQGNIITLTGANATVRGFQFGIGDFASNVTASGDFSTGNYTLIMSSLAANTTYQYRAFATNTAGNGFGASVNFTTLESVPITPPGPGVEPGPLIPIDVPITPVVAVVSIGLSALFTYIAFWQKDMIIYLISGIIMITLASNWMDDYPGVTIAVWFLGVYQVLKFSVMALEGGPSGGFRQLQAMVSRHRDNEE